MPQELPYCCQKCGIENPEACWKSENGLCELVRPEDRYTTSDGKKAIGENKE